VYAFNIAPKSLGEKRVKETERKRERKKKRGIERQTDRQT